jgi:hypothetical protein
MVRVLLRMSILASEEGRYIFWKRLGAILAASVRFCTFGLQGFGFVTLVRLALYWGGKRKGYCHAAAQNQPRKARSCLGTNQG